MEGKRSVNVQANRICNELLCLKPKVVVSFDFVKAMMRIALQHGYLTRDEMGTIRGDEALQRFHTMRDTIFEEYEKARALA